MNKFSAIFENRQKLPEQIPETSGRNGARKKSAQPGLPPCRRSFVYGSFQYARSYSETTTLDFAHSGRSAAFRETLRTNVM